MGVWGQSPQQGPEALLVFGRSVNLKPQICPLLQNLETQRNQIFVLCLQKVMGALKLEQN